MNKNSICQHYCLLPINQCYYCHTQQICYACCYSCSISIEEILTWIIICSLIFFLYNTIKLCIIIFLILSFIYWICKQTDILRLLKQFNSSRSEERISEDNQQANTIVNENDNDQHSLSTKSLLNSNFDIKTISNNDFIKADNYDKPIQIEQMILEPQISLNTSETLIGLDKFILNDIIKQTIETLYEHILQLKTETIDNISNLSLKEQTIPTENISNENKQESSPSIFDDDHRQSKQSSISEITSNDLDNSIQHPKCITVQPSFAINSIMPQVPTKSTVLPIDEHDTEEEKSYDDYINTSKHIITINEQFENIPTRNEQKSENILLLKGAVVDNNEQPDWIYYSSKPDLFPNTIQSDLPIVQSEDQHLSFLSHFHHRSKFSLVNNPATFHSSSLNAIDYIKSFESTSLTIDQQQKLLNDKISFNFIWNKTLNHLKQQIFRVRKSRIILSFDDIQQQKDSTVVQNLSTEMNHARSQLTVNNEQQKKIINSSMVSLFQSFDSVIREGKLLIHNDKSIYQDNNENEDSLSEISNSLYSVTSQLILV